MRNLFILCLFLASGCSYLSKIERPKEDFRGAWSKNLDPAYATGNLPIALNSPLLHEGILYIGENSGFMGAYEASNGAKIFRVKDKGSYHGSPTIVGDDLIYGTNEGRVYSRNKHTGELRYMVDLGASVESKAIFHKGKVFLHTRNHKIFCLDAKTGKILWGYKRSVPYLTTLQRAAAPLVYKGKLFVGMADGFIGAFSLEEGVLLWERKIVEGSKFIDSDVSPLAHNGAIVAGSMSGEVFILSPGSGKVLRKLPWGTMRTPFKLKNGDFVFPQLSGEIVITDDRFTLKKKMKLSESGISSLGTWKGKLIVGTLAGEVLSLDLKSFSVLKRVQTGHSYSAIFGEMAYDKDHLAILTSRNRLYVYR